MKKSVILTLAALAALMAASCQKEETGRILTATFEQYDHNSKAYINDEYYACWENGDAVSINGNRSTIDIENTTATIAAPTSDNLMAFYPADGVTDLTSTGGTVTLQHTQTYSENSNGRQVIDNPMAAYCPEGSNELRFRNLCALLKVTIQVNAPTSVKGIQVKGIDNQMLWGEAQLMLNNQNQPMLTSFTNGSNSVMLNFTTAVAITGSKSFYIVVPAKSDFENLTIAVLTTNGAHSKTSLIEQVLLRNQIGAISYTLNGDEDATFTPDWMIRYTATEAINTTNITGTEFGSTFRDSDFDNDNGYLLFDGPVTTIPAGTSWGSNSGSKYFKSCSSITLPASLTSIGNYAFKSCSTLTSITLPASLTSIGNYAFRECIGLTSINLPANLTSIGINAFQSCSNLTSINLPASLTSIGTNAFQSCSNLTTISLPENLTSIGIYAFSNCSELVRVDCHRTTPPTLGGTNTFSNIPTIAKLHVPSGCAVNYYGWDSHFPDANIVADL